MQVEKIPGVNMTFTHGDNEGEPYVGLHMEMDPPFDTGPNHSAIEFQDASSVVVVRIVMEGQKEVWSSAAPRQAMKALLHKALAMLEQNEVEHTTLEADQYATT